MQNRRKKYFVKEGDHRGLLIGAVIIILSLIFVASGLFYVLANRNLEQATYRAHFEILRNTMQMLLPWLVLVNLIGLAIVVVLAFFLTHKISGPVYHLIKDLESVKNGDLRVTTVFRKGDRLKKLGTAFTETIAELRAKITDIKKKVSNLSSAIDEGDEIKQKIDEIEETLDKLKT
jgi:methyl-accepting chemotaxis protein